ncbi:MAG: hypothetical protein KBA79_01870 [Candidatus Cloacimonetes bacterium]|nr:hypothetical protein [Candidatus Cloacimonadota bacterium]
MKLARIVVIAVLLLCGLAAMGLKGDDRPALKVSGLAYPYKLDSVDRFEDNGFDFGEGDLVDLGNHKTFSWDEVLRMVDSQKGAKTEYSLNWDEIQNLVYNMIFVLSAGQIYRYHLGERLLHAMIHPQGSSKVPLGTHHIRLMLLDPTQEDVRREMRDRLIALLKDENTEALWYLQKTRYLSTNANYIQEADPIFKASYRASIQNRLKELISAVDQTDYQLKAVQSYPGQWELLEQKGNKLYSYTPRTLNLICYRLGKDAAQKLKSYAQQILDAF